jgi:hypothetical protein
MLRYTCYDPNPIQIRPILQTEADSLRENNGTMITADGLDVVQVGSTHKIVLSGPRVGDVVGQELKHEANYFQCDNQRLAILGMPQLNSLLRGGATTMYCHW